MLKKIFISLLIIGVGLTLIFLAAFIFDKTRKSDSAIYGVAFDPGYAEYLGLDPKESFARIFDDFKFKYVRLAARWDLVEEVSGKMDFSQLDWMVDEVQKRNGKIIMVVGQKTPRWPECHIPDWAGGLPIGQYRTRLNEYISATVNRYKDNPVLEIWQVENEPFLEFGGKCPEFTEQNLIDEIKLVKSLDPNHPTMTTDAGEVSLWNRTANKADLFGFTVYRVVWDKNIGYWTYDYVMPTAGYRVRLAMNGRDINTAYAVELQAEPWIPSLPLTSTPISEQFKSMDLNRLKANVEFTNKIGVSRAYLWGAEWWLWLEKQGDGSFVDYVKKLRKE